MRKKIDLSIYFLAFDALRDKKISFPKVCNTFVFFIGVIDLIG